MGEYLGNGQTRTAIASYSDKATNTAILPIREITPFNALEIMPLIISFPFRCWIIVPVKSMEAGNLRACSNLLGSS